LLAGTVAPSLVSGDRVVAIVRPEATRIEPRSGLAGPNRLEGRLVDLVAIGPSLRLKAVTANGHAFEAVANRSTTSATEFHPGDDVLISFDPAFVKVYPDEASLPLQERSI
jgi:regulator of extracellular matrix RemA (YlzA/DUF370 family)